MNTAWASMLTGELVTLAKNDAQVSAVLDA
jgi:hypothetical protein